jgi:glycosyltransferase involved in cell wall biosynthesis
VKVIAVSVMRNEADVVEIFVRHHAEFVDELIIVDHMSCDETGEILRELQAEGLPVTVRSHDSNAYHQSRMMTGIVNEAAKDRGADWITPLDADEFVTSDADPNVRTVLEQLPKEVFRIPWRTYVPQAGDKPDEPHLHRRIQHRREDEGMVHGKVLIPGDLVRRRRLTVSHGSHRVSVRRRFKDRRVKGLPPDDLVLAHFPVRSAAQITLRAVTAWPVRLARGALAKDHWGAHGMFERVARGEVFHPEDLPEIATHYAQRRSEDEPHPNLAVVHDPVQPSGPYELTRPGQPAASPQMALARMMEQFAEELSQR